MDRKVSIIVPVYNAQSYLGYTISSIIRQTYENIEVILVDDGSIDLSLQICKNYAQMDKRIIVISDSNRGVSAARNRGMKEATGEYIQFVDAGDVIHIEMTKNLVELMETYEKDMVVCGFQMINLDDTCRQKQNISFNGACLGKECILTRQAFFQNMATILLNSGLLECSWNKLFRRNYIEQYEIRFPEELSLGEDFCFNMDYFRCINGAVFTGQTFYYYLKVSKNTLTGCYREDYFENQLFLIQKFEKLLMENTKVGIQETKKIKEYLSSKMFQSIENLFHEECELNILQKKKKISDIINHDDVRKALAMAEYIDPKYDWMREKIKYSDVQGIYEWMDTNAHKSMEHGEKGIVIKEELKRGGMNRIIVTICDIMLKLYPFRKIRALRNSIYGFGIKKTVQMIMDCFYYR